MIYLKSRKEIDLMRKAGEIAAEALALIFDSIEPGISTKALDRIAESSIRKRGGEPAFLGYMGYPASICISLNDEVVHGIPSDSRVIEEGDLVSIDLGVRYQGYCGDIAASVVVGKGNEVAERLVDVTKRSLFKGIEMAKPGNRLFDISAAIQETVESAGFSVVRQYVGHGIGKSLHEEPQVPNFGPKGKGMVLKPGLTIAIEPMVNEGSYEVFTLADGWTVKTKDGKLSAHFEHTIAITEDGPEILTLHEKFL
ncbi:MAG: type I methionyl aminopeptidase [Actinobacteria bacterium]|nr:type I methionyl aminopeptidase [Actinomycetota bacterium]